MVGKVQWKPLELPYPSKHVPKARSYSWKDYGSECSQIMEVSAPIKDVKGAGSQFPPHPDSNYLLSFQSPVLEKWQLIVFNLAKQWP